MSLRSKYSLLSSACNVQGWRRGATASLILSTLILIAAALLPFSTVGKVASDPSRAIDNAELGTLERAEELLIRDCMARHGFAMQVSGRQRVLDDRHFPFVVDDVSWARRHGYGSDIRRAIEERSSNDPNVRYFASLSSQQLTAALAALNGPSPEGLKVHLPSGGVVSSSDQGCTSEARATLYTDLHEWFRVSRVEASLPALAAARVLQDPAYAVATEAWANCMSEMGLRYPNPAALRASLPEPAARTTEIRLAVAEASCANRTPLARTAESLHEFYLHEVRSEHQRVVDKAQRMRSAALPLAQRIVQGAHGSTPRS